MARSFFRMYEIKLITGVNIVTILEVILIKKFAKFSEKLSFLKDKTTSINITNTKPSTKPSTNQHQNDVQHKKTDGNAPVSSMFRESGVSDPTPSSSAS